MRAALPRLAVVTALVVLAVGCKKQDETRPPGSDAPASTAEPSEDNSLEDPEESPYLDVSNFNDVVESHLPEVVACYRETVGKAADAPTGRVKTTMVINADGRVKEVGFDAQRSTLKDPALNTCIQGKTAAWKFNISLTGADTPMPYTFDLSESGLLKP